MQVSNEVLNVLSNANVSGNNLFLVGNLDRKLYMDVNKVLEAAGGKWNRSAKSHIFSDDAATRVDEIILTGNVEIPKDEFNYFPTPSSVVEQLLELVEIKEGDDVLEPSAGQGAIAYACVALGANVDCIELMDQNFNILLNDKEVFSSVVNDDFLKIDPFKKYDAIVMNPPFAKQQDIKHVMHAFNSLKDGGVLVSVMSSSVTFRDNKLTQEFRDLVAQNKGEIIPLAEGSFKSSGTMVNTVIVRIPKM